MAQTGSWTCQKTVCGGKIWPSKQQENASCCTVYCIEVSVVLHEDLQDNKTIKAFYICFRTNLFPCLHRRPENQKPPLCVFLRLLFPLSSFTLCQSFISFLLLDSIKTNSACSLLVLFVPPDLNFPLKPWSKLPSSLSGGRALCLWRHLLVLTDYHLSLNAVELDPASIQLSPRRRLASWMCLYSPSQMRWRRMVSVNPCSSRAWPTAHQFLPPHGLSLVVTCQEKQNLWKSVLLFEALSPLWVRGDQNKAFLNLLLFEVWFCLVQMERKSTIRGHCLSTCIKTIGVLSSFSKLKPSSSCFLRYKM